MTIPPSIAEYVKTYGPFTFGVASLLIIWLTIIKPELESKRVDFDANRKIVEEISQQVKILQMNSDTLRETAILLDLTTKRLEKIDGTK